MKLFETAFLALALTVCLGAQAQNTSWQQAGTGQDPAQVLANTPTVGAITMMPGEIYYGPGPITVGYMGAKKQLILPNGPWVLLAVADRVSGHATPVPLVSMAFGQFKEGQLLSLQHFLFNGRPVKPGRAWVEVDQCKAGEQLPNNVLRVPDDVAGGELACGTSIAVNTVPKIVDEAWSKAFDIGAKLSTKPLGAPTVYSRLLIRDKNGEHYLNVKRQDFEEAANSTGRSKALALSRTDWSAKYLPIMIEGFHKRLGATELDINQPKLPMVRVTLPD